jgi:outer membrane receptor protein involved in Fe transport
MSKKRDLLSAGARAALTLALGVAGAMTATPALAQDEEEEIVVTATQRSTALQDVPIAVTPVTADMIENSGIRDVQDLTSVAPALQFNVSENESSATARLRGVGTQGSNPGLESAVGIFIDGVYRARNGVALSDLGEVRQIEVLRGPQGTLFGRNTSAGLITIQTVAPDLHDFSVDGEATYGDWGETRAAATVNIPLSEDVLGLRLFGAVAERDGFMDMNPAGVNPLLGATANEGARDHNNRDMYTLRGQLLAQLGPNADLRLIADYSERNEFCCAAQIYNPTLHNGNPVQIISAVTGLPGAPIPYGVGRMQWVANLGGYGPGVAPATPLGAQGAGNIGDRTGFSNRNDDQNLEDYGASAEFNWDMESGPTFTSVTAYRNWTFARGLDADFSQADLVYVPAGGTNNTEFSVFTQEFRLAGEWGRLDWLVGMFYSDEEIDHRFSFLTGSQYATYFFGLDNILVGGGPAPGLGVFPGPGVSAVVNNIYDELLVGPFAIPAGAGTAGSVDHYRQDGTSFALFTHNIFAITSSTDLTVGVRYTTEDKHLRANYSTLFDAEPTLDAAVSDIEVDAGVPAGTLAAFSNCNAAVVPAGPLAAFATPIAVMRSGYCVPWLRDDLDATPVDQDHAEDEWSGVVSLRQEFGDRVSAYASYSRGYKGGGFNLDRNFSGVFTGGAPNLQFDAELVDAYEVGLKTGWFGNDLLFNVAVFHNEYENFQLNTFNGVQFVVTTVPEVISDGAEVDVIWRLPIEGLSFQGGVAYTDATYGSDCTPVHTCGGWVSQNRNPITGEPTLALLPNSQLTNAPEWTGTAAFTYERPLFGSLVGLFYVDARYVDDQNTGSDLRASKLQPAYTLVNARIGIGDMNEHWSLEFWGRNITDEEYGQIMFDVPLQLGSGGAAQGAFLGDPATYGVTLRAHF